MMNSEKSSKSEIEKTKEDLMEPKLYNYLTKELNKKEKSLIRHGLIVGVILGSLLGFFFCLSFKFFYTFFIFFIVQYYIRSIAWPIR